MKHKFLNSLLSLAAVPLTVATANGALVVYEPFDDSNASLTGNTAGTTPDGLAGNWTATAGWDVLSGSLDGGTLATSGNRVRADSGGNSSVTVTAGTFGTLLNHSSSLWFSILYTTTPGVGGGNPDAGFALGTATLNGTNNIPMSSSGTGVGFSMKSGNMAATTWQAGALGRDTTGTVGREPVVASTTYLIVGEMVWGADAASNDTINLYFPNMTTLALGSVVATRSVVLDQSGFNTITYAMKNDSQPAFFDEIRFGGSSADVLPAIPEPSAALLGGVGMLMLLRRRR